MEYKVKIEPIVILFSVLLLFGLGVRADIETGIRAQEEKVLRLEMQAQISYWNIRSLYKQLEPMDYSQPLEKIIVSSATGIRVNPLGGNIEALHEGVDLIGKKGTPIKAVLAGTVVEHWLPPGWYGGKRYYGHSTFGGYIVIDHGEELFSKYGHLSKTFVHEGDWVEQGEVIGGMGSTGGSTGDHLHLEIAVNPFKYLEERRK